MNNVLSALGDRFPVTREERAAVRAAEEEARLAGDSKEEHRRALQRLHVRAEDPDPPRGEWCYGPAEPLWRIAEICRNKDRLAKE